MKKILVVEDDEDIRESLVEFYSGLGYESFGAENGREALARLRARHPDLVLLDLMMPVMSGWEFMEAWNHDPSLGPQVLVVAFTASNREPPSGVAEVVRKPGDLEQLAGVAQRFVGRP